MAASLRQTDLTEAHLGHADLRRVSLFAANLANASLDAADLRGADLTLTDLRSARLHNADLRMARINAAKLRGADFTGARAADTNFSNVDLRPAKGLEAMVHEGPSTVGIDAIYRSQGKIPKEFLRGVGIPTRPSTRNLPNSSTTNCKIRACAAGMRRTISSLAGRSTNKSTRPFALTTNCC